MAVAVVDVQVKSGNAVGQLQQINTASKAATVGVNGLKNAVTGLVAGFSAIQAARFVFAKTSEIETQTRSLQVLTGSVRQAKQIIEELQQLGAVTPFTSTELIDAAKRLQAFGVEGDRVVEITRRLADASGATGAELQGIVTAYGQVVAKGRLQGEELLQFQERGIGLQQELQRMYGMSGEELQKALSKGQISAQAVEAAIQRLTSAGGKYANGAVAQSDTLAGRFSTLQDGIDQLARRLGQVLTPALKAIFNQAIAVVDAINQALAAGRGGGFTRNVFGARQALNVGATSQAVDNIAKGISQVSSQKNRTGINQNLQALQQYQRLLQGVGADDPNANRAVALQGVILQKINQNIAAQKELNKQSGQQQNLFKPPALGAPSGGVGGGRKGGASDEIAKSLQSGQELNRELARQAQLLKLTSETERQRAQIQFEYEDRTRRIGELKNADQRIGLTLINDEIRKLELQKLATDEVKKQNEELYRRVGLNAQILGAGSGAFRTDIDLLGQQQKALDEVLKKYPQIGEAATAASDLATQGTLQMINGAKTAQQVFADFLNSILDVLVRSAARMIAQYIAIGIARQFAGVGGLFQGAGPAQFPSSTGVGVSGFGIAGSLLPKRANGGSVMAGQSYLVGERGPELFTPARSGSIAPNGAMGASNIVVNVDATGSSVQGDANDSKRLGEAIGVAIRQELIKQKRPGGLLA